MTDASPPYSDSMRSHSGGSAGARASANTATPRRKRSRDRYDKIGEYVQPQANGCWVYSGTIDRMGYGRYSGEFVHRWMYEALRGPIPEGHAIHHACFNKACCNPDHLVPLTPSDHKSLHIALDRAG